MRETTNRDNNTQYNTKTGKCGENDSPSMQLAFMPEGWGWQGMLNEKTQHPLAKKLETESPFEETKPNMTPPWPIT